MDTAREDRKHDAIAEAQAALPRCDACRRVVARGLAGGLCPDCNAQAERYGADDFDRARDYHARMCDPAHAAQQARGRHYT